VVLYIQSSVVLVCVEYMYMYGCILYMGHVIYFTYIYMYMPFPPVVIGWIYIRFISYHTHPRHVPTAECDVTRERNSISIPQHSPLPPPAPLSAALLPSQSPSLSAAARPPPRASSTWPFGAASVALLSAGWDIFFAGRDGQGSGPIDRAGGRRVGRSSSFLWREGK